MLDGSKAEGLPLISVAMCTHNGARYVAEQLESIICQSYRNIEIIIADDGSMDGTVGLLKEFQLRDPRIRIIENQINLGFVGNFQQVLMHSRGSLIALADQDDIWLPSKLDSLRRELGDNLLIYSNVALMDENGVALNKHFPKVKRLEGSCALSLILDNCVTGHACLLRRELLEKALPFPANIPLHDQWLAIVAASCGKLKASDRTLSFYRMHGNNAILKGKRTRKESGRRKKQLRDQKCLDLVDAMIGSGLFSSQEKALLLQFSEHLKQNTGVFYNFGLARFLRRHSDKFLDLFQNQDKVLRKLCRGDWFFRVLPFA